MTYSVWQATAQKTDGAVIPSATVTVKDSNGDLAVIYSDGVGVGKQNPFTAPINGFVQFFAAGGSYSVEAVDSDSGQVVTWDNVLIGSAAGFDVGIDAGQLPTNATLGVTGKTNWTSGNLNPLDIDGIGFTAQFKLNTYAGAVDTISGGDLVFIYIDQAGQVFQGGSPSGLFLNNTGMDLDPSSIAVLTRIA
ncbi:MAG: hypothetical protein GY886_05870 [Gammaproteobacteria bacterium]|nr:hypothetical protein [Gammaproteobacteria bacterium]